MKDSTYFVTDDAGRILAVNDDTGQIAIEMEYNPVDERICLACGVGGCDCDSECVNCGSKDPSHHCD